MASNYVFEVGKPIAIGSDHAGFAYKKEICTWLLSMGYEVTDFGTNSTHSVDYPDFAHPTAIAVEKKVCSFGILLCGSANGVAITANKHQKIRAGLCWNESVASLVRAHNNANIVCIPARFVTLAQAINIIETFMSTSFEGGRHMNRIDKISCT